MPWTPLVSRAVGFRVTASVWDTDIVDNLNYIINASGNLAVVGTGPHALGTAVDVLAQLKIGGTFSPSSSGNGVGVLVAPTLNAAVGQQCFGLYISPTLAEAGSGAHSSFASAVIAAPTINAGAASLGVATTLYVAGVPTATAALTTAVYIATGSDDGVHVALQNSDVAHGITDSVPTDIYGTLRKASATDGGLSIAGYTEGVAGVQFIGNATTVTTTEAGASRGNIQLIAVVKSGTGTASHAADDNILTVLNGTSCAQIVKGNGDVWQDGTAGNVFDDHDDVALIEALEWELSTVKGNPIDRVFSQFMHDNRQTLTDLRLATFDENGSIFINNSRLMRLSLGAHRQTMRRLVALEARFAALSQEEKQCPL